MSLKKLRKRKTTTRNKKEKARIRLSRDDFCNPISRAAL
jgi:hypothetical protein